MNMDFQKVAGDIRGIGARVRQAAAAFKSSSEKLGRDIDGLRTEVVKLKAERVRIAALPITKQMAIERIEKLCATMRTNKNAGIDRLADTMMAAKEGMWNGFLGGVIDAAYDRRVEWAVAEIVRKGLLEIIESRYAAGVTGIDDAKRERELARIDGEILDCDLAEEAMIRAAAAVGITIARRPDADPRAVMARDQDLPA
jgi:hypothetical protein